MAVGKPAINLATLRNGWSFAEAVDGCLRHGITAISPWRDHIESVGLDEMVRIIESNRLTITSLCRGGMFTAATAGERQAALDDNRRAIDEAAAIGAQCVVLVTGPLPAGSRDIDAARRMVADGIAAVLPHARANNIPLAIEPLHPMYAADRSGINTIDQALDLCATLGEGIGITVDTYHTWWDPNLAASIARAGRERRILAHHISDWLVPTTDMLNDRGMMGDGVVDFKSFRQMVEAAGYTGPQEVEIFSRDNWWKRPGDDVLATILDRFASVC